MKKLYFIIIAFFLTCSISFGQMAGDSESLIPSDVNILVKSKEISKLTKTLNYIVNNLMDESQRADFFAKRDEFKQNTGIDYLDESSLKNAGIDTSRSLAFANFDKDKLDEVNLFFIPVSNEEDAVLRFIEVIKKIKSDDPDSNIEPVTTKYKNLTVYELKNDIYAACVNKYLVIGSTSAIIKQVIDHKDSRNKTLILDANYNDFLSRIGSGYDLNVFVTKRFLMNMYSKHADNNNIYSMKNFILTQAYSNKMSDDEAFVDSIDYISAGIGLDNNKIQVSASVKFAKDKKIVNDYLGFLKTGVHSSSIYVPTADSAVFFSLDYQYINNFCKGEVEWCEQFNSSKEEVKNETGIDFDKDFIPYLSGGMNIIYQDTSASTGGFGDIVVFAPMTDQAKIEQLWNKMKKFYQTKYSPSKKFGEEKIGSSKAFWFIDESQMRIFVSCDKRGIFAGNSSVLMKSSLASNTTITSVKSGRYKDIINDKTFFLLNIKKNSFMNMFMNMNAQGNSNVTGWINRLGEIFLYSEKNDNFISLNLEVEIKEPKSKK